MTLNDIVKISIDMEIVGYMKDGMIDDWDVFEKILDYTYAKCIKSESEFHPVLMSEAPVILVILKQVRILQ